MRSVIFCKSNGRDSIVWYDVRAKNESFEGTRVHLAGGGQGWHGTGATGKKQTVHKKNRPMWMENIKNGGYIFGHIIEFEDGSLAYV